MEKEIITQVIQIKKKCSAEKDNVEDVQYLWE